MVVIRFVNIRKYLTVKNETIRNQNKLHFKFVLVSIF